MKNKVLSFFFHKLYLAFTSPLFYIVALIVDFVCSINFFFGKNFFGGAGSTNLYYFFVTIPYISILLVPILCIKSTGSSYDDFVPVSRLQIIIANWLSIFVQYVLILLPLVFVPFCVNLFGTVDFGQVFTSFIMIILFGLAACSIGIFFYYIFPSNTLSFIFTSLCLGITNILHFLTEYITNSNFISFVVKLFSFSWHFNSASKGILDSRDVVYFITISFVFVFVTFIFSEKKMGKKLSSESKICNILLLLICVFTLLNSNKYYFRFDFTLDKKFTVSNYSKSLLKESDDFINITYYRSSVLDSLYPQVRDVDDFLKEYSNYGKILYKVVNPEKDNSAVTLKNYGIEPRQIKTMGNNKTEYVNAYSAIVIEYLGKWEVIPFVISTVTLEYDLDGRINHLVTDKQRIVNILCGNGMSLEKDYSYVIPWLNSQGFICNEIDLNSELLPQLEKYSKTLVVIGSENLTDNNCADIEAYIQNGNNVLFFVSPYSIDIKKSWSITKSKNQKLIRMLESYGIDFTENIIADSSCAKLTLESSNTNYNNDYVYSKQINYPFWINILPQKEAKHGITLFWPVSILSLEDSVIPLILSSSSSYEVKPNFSDESSSFITNPFLLEEQGFNPFNAKLQKKNAVVKLQGELNAYYQIGKIENSNLIIVPDQYFVHSLMLGYVGGALGDYRNLDFLVNQLLKINGEEELAYLQSKFSNQNNQFFHKVYDEISFIKAKNSTIFCVFILNPLIIFVSFGLSIFLRKRYFCFSRIFYF